VIDHLASDKMEEKFENQFWVRCLQGVIFLSGTLAFIDLYFAIYEYSEGLADLSWIEILLIGVLIALLTRHFKHCRKRKLHWWETIRRPFISVGWFYLVSIGCVLVLLALKIITFDDIYESYLMPDSLIIELIWFGFVFASILLGTPKAFVSPWCKAKYKKAKA